MMLNSPTNLLPKYSCDFRVNARNPRRGPVLGLSLRKQFCPQKQFLPDENFGRHSQVDKTAYTVDDKIRDSKK